MAALANPTKWYVGSSKWTAVTAWPSLTAVAAGVLRRQSAAPTVGNERVFICIIAGTTLVAEPTWTITKGAKTAEAAGPTWQECTGQPAVNGDSTNTVDWNSAKNNTVALGQIIKDIAGTHYFICTTAGTSGNGSEPTWGVGAVGNTTADNTVTWTYIGLVSTFSSTPWGATFARLQSAWASTWATAGDLIYVSNHHSETQSTAMTLTSPGTASSFTRVQGCIDTAAPPTTADTTANAQIFTTGASDLNFAGFAYVYGITFIVGSGAGGASALWNSSSAFYWVLDTCAVVLFCSAATNTIRTGRAGFVSTEGVEFRNTNVGFNAAGAQIVVSGSFRWYGGLVSNQGAIPTTLFSPNLGTPGWADIADVDFSLLGSGKNLVSVSQTNPTLIYFRNCKLGSSVSVINGTVIGPGGTQVFLDNCDSGNTNYRFEHYKYQGSIVQETTKVRTGGATDGTTGISHKMVSLATGPALFSPLEGLWISFWNDSTSSITITVELCTENVVLTNADCWLECEYLGTASFPMGVFTSSRVANVFASAANLTTSSASWAGFSTAAPQSISLTFTPASKGPMRVRVCVGAASKTVYVDPLVTSSSGSPSRKQFLLAGFGFDDAPASGGLLTHPGMAGGMRG